MGVGVRHIVLAANGVLETVVALVQEDADIVGEVFRPIYDGRRKGNNPVLVSSQTLVRSCLYHQVYVYHIFLGQLQQCLLGSVVQAPHACAIGPPPNDFILGEIRMEEGGIINNNRGGYGGNGQFLELVETWVDQQVALWPGLR